MKSNLHLTELIDVEILQQIQDAFSNMAGVSALTTDNDGIAVTKGSNFTDFCTFYTRNSPLGKKRCEECDKRGAEAALRIGASCVYQCHAGLIDFSAPIMANGKIVGSFIGGQVLIAPPDLDKIAETAKELGINPDEYIEAVKKVKIMDKETLDKAAQFLYVVANILSDIAYKSHTLYINNIEIENASHLKSDFLANMSHEIRTPMNAVLGMADLALREEMSPVARNFVNQIKTSAKSLLVIINDILDFSKIESGKMDIINADYEPLSLINDIVNIINSRIKNKNIEFTIDINPELPENLFGDNIRLQQIILNLLNNAVKFTKQGEVHLKVDFEHKSEKEIILKITVRDTGIGIKEEDFDKLFNSFQQLDSKRNRNIEGTGLGLAISQQLINLMNGKMSVESEYGKGSSFHFELPQRVIDNTASIPKFEKKFKVAFLINNKYIQSQIITDLKRINADYIELDNYNNSEKADFDYLIIEKDSFNQGFFKYLEDNSNIQCILIDDYDSKDKFDMPNIRIIHKPVYSLNLYNALGAIDISFVNNSENAMFTFTAPDANILIVDDNSVNLTVAKGLIEPFEMNVDTATSAMEAIEKVSHFYYDIVFMDHMMPEVDGVEATHIIRRLMPNYSSVPIIALTANAVNGTKEMFIKEGMNDFIPKPIDMKDMTAKLKKWLPESKIIFNGTVKKENCKSDNSVMNIEGLNVELALSLLGNEQLFNTILKEYYMSIDKKSDIIEKYWKENNWKNYTIEVHSLKSLSKQIGAEKISEIAAEMEAAGNCENTELINQKTEYLLCEYRKYKDILKPLFDNDETKTEKLIENDKIIDMLEKMQTAIEDFDILEIDDVMSEMSEYKYPDIHIQHFERLKQAVEESNLENCIEILKAWKKTILNVERLQKNKE